jgi:hypothetical protein
MGWGIFHSYHLHHIIFDLLPFPSLISFSIIYFLSFSVHLTSYLFLFFFLFLLLFISGLDKVFLILDDFTSERSSALGVMSAAVSGTSSLEVASYRKVQVSTSVCPCRCTVPHLLLLSVMNINIYHPKLPICNA